MTDLERVKAWFESGDLVQPRAEALNFVDLVRALGRLCGAAELPSGPGVESLCGAIGQYERYVLVLVDGMGRDQVLRLPHDAFLRRHVATELQPVFLSTTAAALTTLATGRWPAQHGAPGWWTYLPEGGVSAVMLPFQERLTERDLAECGVRPEELFPVPSFWPQLRHRPFTLLPGALVGSVFSRYSRGETAAAGYTSLTHAMDLARHAATSGRGPGLVYLYLPQLDSMMHERGVEHDEVARLLLILDRELRALAGAVAGKARLIVTADHGHVTVPTGRTFVLPVDDPLRQMLLGQPSGEPSVPIFHVRDGYEEQFACEFRTRFGAYFALLSLAEVRSLQLLGPGELSPATAARMGSFVGIAPQPCKLYIEPCAGCHVEYLGVHGGLRPAEMTVPLVLA